MSIDLPLYEGKLVCFTPINMDTDPAEQARWMQNIDYLRLFSHAPARPLSAARIKKNLELIEKEQDEKQNTVYFSIRTLNEARLIGYARFLYIDWSHSAAAIELVIAEIGDRRQGFGGDALRLLQRYAFHELNLHRLSVTIPEYNQDAFQFFTRAGFVTEVCRRNAVQRDLQVWNVYILGLLRSEWQAQ
jgi:RimJ/RimL family protein N-acetyltransferase